ncbi:MAG: pyridoxal phosphate-dependent aminotransferase [Lachnospiraceae bacterium]|nr:pyridoxal phosphate-dependent aminotransferase [Lachnospiraceae bacterium]
MNQYLQTVKKSASIELMSKAAQMKKAGVDVISLAGGEPDFDTPQKIRDKVVAELSRGNTHYAVGKGLIHLRRAIKQKFKIENHIDYAEDEILVTPGGKMAIYLAVRACINVGDEVMILNPAWVSYSQIVIASGGIPVGVKLSSQENYAITKEALESYYTERTKVIIINSPNNPTGRVINQNEVNTIKEFMEGKDIVIISDEIYEEIIYEDFKHISIASIKELRNKTITINGFSKGYAMTGWRMAYMAGDISLIDTIYKLYSHTITGTSPFLQEACITAFDCDEDVVRMRNIYHKRRKEFISGLNQIERVSAKYPEGTFYAWVKFDIGNMDSFEIANYLLEETHVIGVPGSAYGLGSEKYIRFSFANNEKDLKDAVERIEEGIRRLRTTY